MLADLSIIIPSYRRTDLLTCCLASVTRHAPPGTEILVVDDGSPDHAVTRTAQRFGGVQVLRLPRRRGYCAAANAGVEAVRGPFVELLNDDTEVTSGWADAALAAFRDATVAAVAPLVLVGTARQATEYRIDSAGDRYDWGGIAGKRGHGEVLGPTFLQAGPVFGASASSAFYRRAVLREVGAFPESFGAYFEDVDLSFRLHWAGYQVIFAPESRVFHQGSASYAVPRGRFLEQQSLNEERVFWRNLPGPALVKALPRHLAVVAAKAWQRWQERRLGPFLCGRLRVLAELPSLLRHRRNLHQRYRTANLETWHLERRFWN